jgi:hypothetical protein
MDQRRQRQEILGILLAHRPQNASFVRGRIPEHAEDSLYQVGKPILFAALTLSCQLIDRNSRGRTAQCCINEFRAVLSQAGFCAEFVSNAPGRLKHRVEVVVSYKLCTTETQYVWMYSTPR